MKDQTLSDLLELAASALRESLAQLDTAIAANPNHNGYRRLRRDVADAASHLAEISCSKELGL